MNEMTKQPQDIVAELEKKVRALMQKNELLEQQKNNQDSVINLLNANKVQLEATVTAVREQRDRLLEAEADGIVNVAMMELTKDNEIKLIQSRFDSLMTETDPVRARLVQMEAALNEVREKFGDVQHKRKVAEADLDTSNRELNDYYNALEWYSKVSNKSKRNILKRYEAATGIELTPNIIRQAHLLSMNGEPFELDELLISTYKEMEAEKTFSKTDNETETA